jgi:MFS transporter, ACS family, tartrate transporter
MMKSFAKIMPEPHSDAADGLSAVPAAAARLRIFHRILPFVFILYVLAYIDRANVAFANRPMSADLGFSAEVFGFGAGVFFVGYFLLQIPGALIVERWSARRLIAAILVSWGLLTMLIGFVRTPGQFYASRFMLGAAEAGLFPGVLVYLTHWFRANDRARATARFALAAPVALTIGAPLSGLILKIHWLGAPGWRWIFILQGIPAILFGGITLFYLPDRPRDARWLTAPERNWIEGELRREEALKGTRPRKDWWRALGHRDVLLLTGASFCANLGGYGFILWLPNTLNRGLGLPLLLSTMLAALPFAAAIVASLLVGWSSDRTGERKWHTCCVFLGASLFLVLGSLPGQPVALSVVWMCLVGAAVYSWIPPFWVLPGLMLSESEAAASIGMINSVGNLGGFAGPWIAGYLLTRGAGYGAVLLALAASYGASAVFTALVRAPALGRRVKGAGLAA